MATVYRQSGLENVIIPTNIISLIYCSHQIFYNIQVESCSPVIITNIVF